MNTKQTKAWSKSDTIATKHKVSRRLRFGLLFIIVSSAVLLSGCQAPTTFETSISLLPPEVETADPNIPAPEPVDPLDVLIAVEKIASKAGLEPYTAGDDEAFLLDIADTDLLDESGSSSMNVTEWKHPNLPVYLTVTRKNEEILLLLNHTPDETGKPNPDAKKLFEVIQKQLTEIIEISMD